jgi:hypothetical protein
LVCIGIVISAAIEVTELNARHVVANKSLFIFRTPKLYMCEHKSDALSDN